MQRRTFLISTAAMLAGAPRAMAAASPRIDAHVHCFAGPANARFPYHPRGPYEPEEAATGEQLIAAMDAAGVTHAVIVHPEPYQDDHRYLEYCLSLAPKRLKGTLLLFGDRPGSLEQLPQLLKQMAGSIIALRVHAYAPERLPPFTPGVPELRRIWKAAADHGIGVQLHIEPRYAPHFTPLIEEFKQVRLIIDHLGRPLQGTPAEHDVVLGWSRWDHTVMKISSLPDHHVYPHRDIRPILRRITESFGVDRCIHGGGFGAGATGASYNAAFKRAGALLEHLSPADQAKIFGLNAARLFKWD